MICPIEFKHMLISKNRSSKIPHLCSHLRPAQHGVDLQHTIQSLNLWLCILNYISIRNGELLINILTSFVIVRKQYI